MADPLPPRLEEVLEAVADRALAAKLRRAIEAAAEAIERLGHLSLVKLEPATADDGTADLSLWEKMAPAVRDTVVGVNALLRVIDAEFPDSEQPITELPSHSDDRSAAEAGMVFRAIAGRLERDVNEVGGMMRNPDLVGSRWALLAELQRLRLEFRTRIGDAVYLSAAACAPVRREDVVPGFMQELARASLFRSTMADVRRNVAEKVASAKVEPKVAAKHIDTDFDIFATLPSWRHVRAEPKRQMLGLREALQHAAAQPGLTREALNQLVEPALDLLRALGEEQSRFVLPTHDRNVILQAQQLLEQAELHLVLDTGAASAALGRAIAACAGLYGREESFDVTLRALRTKPVLALSQDALREEVEHLREALAGIKI